MTLVYYHVLKYMVSKQFSLPLSVCTYCTQTAHSLNGHVATILWSEKEAVVLVDPGNESDGRLDLLRCGGVGRNEPLLGPKLATFAYKFVMVFIPTFVFLQFRQLSNLEGAFASVGCAGKQSEGRPKLHCSSSWTSSFSGVEGFDIPEGTRGEWKTTLSRHHLYTWN